MYRPLYMFVGGCISGEPVAEAEVEANADDESLTLRRRPNHSFFVVIEDSL